MITLDQLKARNDATISPAEAAAVLSMSPQQVRLLARERPEILGFPVITYGSRCRIPRIPFIKYLEGEK